MAQSTNPQTNYYNTGDVELRYMEIGIALKAIDRMNPGSIPFCIPALMPKENKTSVTDKKIVQNSKTNILTENKAAVDVSNIEVSNAIYITIPKELTALPGAVYDFEGTLFVHTGSEGRISMSETRMAGSGSVPHPGDSINVVGTVSGNVDSFSLPNATIKGTATFTLNEVNRYIGKNSKWLIAFIGGDTSMPQVVCRLPDDVDHVSYEYANME